MNPNSSLLLMMYYNNSNSIYMLPGSLEEFYVLRRTIFILAS